MPREYKVRTKPAMRPPHPGSILRLDVVPALDISVVQAARELGVSRQLLHGILGPRSCRSRRRWPYGWASGAAMARACGCGCSRRMTCGMRNGHWGQCLRESHRTRWGEGVACPSPPFALADGGFVLFAR